MVDPPRRPALPWLLLLGGLSGAAAFGFSVEPHATECFEEHAGASDHVSGLWTLTLPGDANHEPHHGDDAPPLPHLEGWSVTVTGPAGDKVYHAENEREGAFDYYATIEGVYRLCFTNQRKASAEVTAKIEVGDPPDLIQLAKTEHLTPIEERIKNVRSCHCLRCCLCCLC